MLYLDDSQFHPRIYIITGMDSSSKPYVWNLYNLSPFMLYHILFSSFTLKLMMKSTFKSQQFTKRKPSGKLKGSKVILCDFLVIKFYSFCKEFIITNLCSMKLIDMIMWFAILFLNIQMHGDLILTELVRIPLKSIWILRLRETILSQHKKLFYFWTKCIL